jgi:hypothetical protein
LFQAHSYSAREPAVNGARRTAVQIDNCVEPPTEQFLSGLDFAPGRKDFVEIGIAVKASEKAVFDKDGYAELREFFLKRPDRTRQQQAISHRTQSHEENPCVLWKTLK